MPNRIDALSRALILPLAAASAVALLAPSAEAAPSSSAQYLYSNPTAQKSARYCHPEDLSRCTLGNDLIRRLDALKRGGHVDAVAYSLTRDDVGDALLRAAKRGVKVRVLTSHPKPDGEVSDDLSDEMADFLDDLKRAGGKTTVGWGALARSGKAGLEHEKLVLIDPDGKVNGNESTISDSGNWTYSLDTAHNDRMVVRDECMYRGTLTHLDRLAKDRKISHESPVKTCDGKRRIYFMPASRTDPVMSWARKAKCGKGDRVDFANFYLAGGKGADLVDELIRFRRAGADVRVAANDELTGHWSVSLKRRLVKAGVAVYDVSVPLGGRKVYGHRKMLDATGCSGGAFGSQGSTTMNTTAYRSNGNAVLTTKSATDVSAMRRGFDAMVNGKDRVKS